MNSQNNPQTDTVSPPEGVLAEVGGPVAPQIEEGPLTLSSSVGRRGGPKTAPLPVENLPPPARPRSKGIGRGGISAIVMLVVFLPIIAFLIFVLLDANNKIDSLQRSLRNFQASANPAAQADFAAMLSQPNLQTLPFKTEDGTQMGRFILYSTGNTNWAISYGQLEPLERDQIYGVWLVSKIANKDGPTYVPFITLPDVRTGGNIRMVQQAEFPSGFQVGAYSQVVVTIENLTQLGTTPHGPRRFALDLSQLH